MAKGGSTVVSGTTLRFIDDSGTEWYYEGTVTSSVTPPPNTDFWVAGQYCYYLDENDEVRQLPREVNKSVPGQYGSAWVEDSVIKFVDENNDKVAANYEEHVDTNHDNNHSDTSHTNSHSDTSHTNYHSDTDHSNSHSNYDHTNSQQEYGHVDSGPHSDHTDSGSDHNDHTDYGSDHSDHTDTGTDHSDHTDSGTEHNDHTNSPTKA